MRPVSVRNRRQGSNIAIMHVRRQTKIKIKWGLVLNGVVITKISKKNNMLLNHWANIPLSFCTHRSRQSGPWKVELTSLWWRPCHACLRRNWLWKRFSNTAKVRCHSYVMTWKHLLHYWPFVRGIHRPPVDPPHEGPVIRSFIFFYVAILSKMLNKQSSCRRFEKSWRSYGVTSIAVLWLFWTEIIIFGWITPDIRMKPFVIYYNVPIFVPLKRYFGYGFLGEFYVDT